MNEISQMSEPEMAIRSKCEHAFREGLRQFDYKSIIRFLGITPCGDTAGFEMVDMWPGWTVSILCWVCQRERRGFHETSEIDLVSKSALLGERHWAPFVRDHVFPCWKRTIKTCQMKGAT